MEISALEASAFQRGQSYLLSGSPASQVEKYASNLFSQNLIYGAIALTPTITFSQSRFQVTNDTHQFQLMMESLYTLSKDHQSKSSVAVFHITDQPPKVISQILITLFKLLHCNICVVVITPSILKVSPAYRNTFNYIGSFDDKHSTMMSILKKRNAVDPNRLFSSIYEGGGYGYMVGDDGSQFTLVPPQVKADNTLIFNTDQSQARKHEIQQTKVVGYQPQAPMVPISRDLAPSKFEIWLIHEEHRLRQARLASYNRTPYTRGALHL